MVLLPVRTLPLVSDLDPPALASVLRRTIGGEPDKPFFGSVREGSFIITRLREFRSTFMPVLRCRLAPAPAGGTRLRLRLVPPPVVLLFMAIWYAFLSGVAALIIAGHALGAGRSFLWLLAPAGLAGLSWHVMASVFDADARWAVAHLLEQLPALRLEGTSAAGAGTRAGVAHLW